LPTYIACDRASYSSRAHPTSTPFPYTTLFRSQAETASGIRARLVDQPLEQRDDRPILDRAHDLNRGADHPDTRCARGAARDGRRSEEHTSELQSRENLVCRLLLEKKKYNGQTV